MRILVRIAEPLGPLNGRGREGLLAITRRVARVIEFNPMLPSASGKTSSHGDVVIAAWSERRRNEKGLGVLSLGRLVVVRAGNDYEIRVGDHRARAERHPAPPINPRAGGP